MNKNPKKNHEGYDDPTAYEALKRVEANKRKIDKLIHTMKTTADLAGFTVEERIVLKNKKTGEVWY